MNETTYADVMARLDAIAEKLGVAAGHLWAVLIKQAIVSSISMTILTIVGILIEIYGYKFVSSLSSKPKDKVISEGGFNYMIFAWCLFSIYSIILLLTIIGNLEYIMTGFTNPEFTALKFILDSI